MCVFLFSPLHSLTLLSTPWPVFSVWNQYIFSISWKLEDVTLVGHIPTWLLSAAEEKPLRGEAFKWGTCSPVCQSPISPFCLPLNFTLWNCITYFTLTWGWRVLNFQLSLIWWPIVTLDGICYLVSDVCLHSSENINQLESLMWVMEFARHIGKCASHHHGDTFAS